MNNNNENKNKQENDQLSGKGGQAPKKSFFAKRWTFPVIYLAASVLIVGLMYAKSKDATPYQVKPQGQDTGSIAGPVLPNPDPSQPANAVPTFMWPVGDGGQDATISMAFYHDDASDDAKAAAVVAYDKSFTPHEGVDLGLKSDQPFTVIAAAKGTVKMVKEDPLMGHVIEIDHGQGYTTYYASLQNVDVKAGDMVMAGQPIAKTGNNRFEKSEKNHLHFELRKNGVSIDPNTVLSKKPFGDATSTSAGVTSSTSTEPSEAATKDEHDSAQATNKDVTQDKSQAGTDNAVKEDSGAAADTSKDTSGDASKDSSKDAGQSSDQNKQGTSPSTGQGSSDSHDTTGGPTEGTDDMNH